MKNFIYILMFMVSVVWSLESTISAHVKITNLDGDVLYDTVMVVKDYCESTESDDSIDFVEYFSRHLEFDYKDKSFYIEIKEKYNSKFRLSYVTSYMNGKKHGIEKRYYRYYRLGKLRWVTPYVNGKEHGIKKGYYDSGQLYAEMPHVNGKRHGVVKGFTHKGKVKSTAKYKNGVLDGYKRCSDGRFGNEELECQ